MCYLIYVIFYFIRKHLSKISEQLRGLTKTESCKKYELSFAIVHTSIIAFGKNIKARTLLNYVYLCEQIEEAEFLHLSIMCHWIRGSREWAPLRAANWPAPHNTVDTRAGLIVSRTVRTQFHVHITSDHWYAEQWQLDSLTTLWTCGCVRTGPLQKSGVYVWNYQYCNKSSDYCYFTWQLLFMPCDVSWTRIYLPTLTLSPII